MTNGSVEYRGTGGSNVPNTIPGVFSPNIWTGMRINDLRNGRIQGALFEMRDWSEYALAGTLTTQIGFGKFKVFASTGGTLAPTMLAAKPVGNVLKGLFDTDADNSISIAQAYPSFRLSGLTTTSGKLAFEAEVAVNVITTNGTSMFCGLAETDLFTLADAVPLNAGDPTDASGAMIGFRHLEDGLGTVDTCYNDRATSLTNIGDDEGTIAAATLVKWGMIYDPLEATRCVRFFQNGIELPTAMTRAALVALTNLDAGALGFLFASCADTVDAGIVYISQLRVAQFGPA